MSTKPGGVGAGHCDACGRAYTWGCGHSASQEAASRKHDTTQKHKERRCACYGHDYCDPKKCSLAGITISGYMPFEQHTPNPKSLDEQIEEKRRAKRNR